MMTDATYKKTIINKDRQSNIELLRIISMFMILVFHSGFRSLGLPTVNASITHSQIIIILLTTFFSVYGVNVFVMISGYFGIKFIAKGITRFIFLCLFYSIGIYLYYIWGGVVDLSLRGIAHCFYLYKINWFIKAYLCLFIIAPILNSYVDNTNSNQLSRTIIIFYVFQAIYGWVTDSTEFISWGYSTISFIGLYLIARYYRKYGIPYIDKMSAIQCLSTYIIISLILVFLGYITIEYNKYGLYNRLHVYTNPLVIIGAIILLAGFLKFNIRSKLINTIGGSVFAVYLIHANVNVFDSCFAKTINYFQMEEGDYFILYVFAFLIFVFMFSILIDQIRVRIWKVIEYRVFD